MMQMTSHGGMDQGRICWPEVLQTALVVYCAAYQTAAQSYGNGRCSQIGQYNIVYTYGASRVNTLDVYIPGSSSQCFELA